MQFDGHLFEKSGFLKKRSVGKKSGNKSEKKSRSRAFICVMNIGVKIKVVEETQLYRKFWISASGDCPGGELWKVDGRQMEKVHFLTFDGDLDFRETKISSFFGRISSFYMWNEYCGQNKSCRGDPTIYIYKLLNIRV